MTVDTCEVPECGNLAEWRASDSSGRVVCLCERHASEVRDGDWSPGELEPTADEAEAA